MSEVRSMTQLEVAAMDRAYTELHTAQKRAQQRANRKH
jgi:hypothetical protein